VERRRDPDDRRYVQVHLTDAGRTLIADIFPDHVQQIVDIFGVLTDGEIEEFGRLCKKLGVRNTES
jgi:MarR family 2-MHQ and catechol resistance regulon transcriptional repressor